MKSSCSVIASDLFWAESFRQLLCSCIGLDISFVLKGNNHPINLYAHYWVRTYFSVCLLNMHITLIHIIIVQSRTYDDEDVSQTLRDEAATTIQSHYRKYQSRKYLAKVKNCVNSSYQKQLMRRSLLKCSLYTMHSCF